MTRLAWLLVSACAAALAVGLVTAGFVVSERGSSRTTTTVPTDPGSGARRFDLPLADDPSAFMLARHDRNLLVGLAARPGGPVEIAAVRAETPVAGGVLSFRIGSRAVEATSCGDGCFRLDVPVLAGSPTTIEVRTPGAPLTFPLPARPPRSGERIFARAERTMGALRSFRYTERLSSGSTAIVSNLDVRAPDSLRLESTGGFRSVIIGRRRWDYRNGRWERSSFPGLMTSNLYMWQGASHARVLGRGRAAGRPVTVLALFDREPFTAWFRIAVQPNGRVLEAEMLAPSHFMRHRFRDFDRPLKIAPPRRS